MVVAVNERVRFRKKVMAYRKFRRSRGDWLDQTKPISFFFKTASDPGLAISVSTDKSADIRYDILSTWLARHAMRKPTSFSTVFLSRYRRNDYLFIAFATSRYVSENVFDPK